MYTLAIEKCLKNANKNDIAKQDKEQNFTQKLITVLIMLLVFQFDYLLIYESI